MAATRIESVFLRDTRHGGPVTQPQTVATRLAAFVRKATTTLDLAIYDFRLTDAHLADIVVNAIIKAAAKGITVRLAYDAGKPSAATAATFAAMAADPAPPGTAQWVANHFGNSDVQIKAITAPSGQLMHSKYMVRDGAAGGATAAVWTGSTNFTDDAWTLQENNIITIASPTLAAAYRSDFEDLWSAGSIKKTGVGDTGTTTVGATTLGWDFAPGDGTQIDAALAAAVAAAKTRIVLATMVLTSHALLTALVSVISAGVPVSGIYDSGQMGPIEREWAKSTNSAAILANWKKVKTKLVAKTSAPYKPTSPHDFMHNKILIADNQLITGSYNFSANAERNAENQIRITVGSTIVKRYAEYITAIVTAYQ